ncbi:hypothetical protein [Halomonas cupida]|uniref:hypothetical protein n=1 Tax=Halomonas cupida TaxID=44933 RepID=UPI003A94D866
MPWNELDRRWAAYQAELAEVSKGARKMGGWRKRRRELLERFNEERRKAQKDLFDPGGPAE